MNSEQWQNFSDQITQNLALNYTLLSTITTESLETTWHKIQTSIINAILQYIPTKNLKFATFNTISHPKQLNFTTISKNLAILLDKSRL